MDYQSISREHILELIYKIIEDHNKLNPDTLKLKKSPYTLLLGEGGNLDSLGFITFLVEIENSIKTNIDKNIRVIDEMLFLDVNGPYKNIDTLIEYIISKIRCK